MVTVIVYSLDVKVDMNSSMVFMLSVRPSIRPVSQVCSFFASSVFLNEKGCEVMEEYVGVFSTDFYIIDGLMIFEYLQKVIRGMPLFKKGHQSGGGGCGQDNKRLNL